MSVKDNMPSNSYKSCNHHHEITEDQSLITIGGNTFVADNELIPLLDGLNNIGLRTRTHNYSEDGSFISIVLDERMSFEIKKVFEKDADRTSFNGETELLIQWKPKIK